jgi:DNA invertase Pin-like site-specific DNA recombinase
MPNPRPRIATYVRVSTDNQVTENQKPEVEQLALQRGEIVARYTEVGSAAKHRPVFERMFKDARLGRFDILVIWSIDRFGRSMLGNLNDLVALEQRGVRVVSVREGWLDGDAHTRQLLIGIVSWMAEQERIRISERTKAGLARARRQGKTLGRRRRWVDLERARALLAEGLGIRRTAAALGVGHGTLQRALARG